VNQAAQAKARRQKQYQREKMRALEEKRMAAPALRPREVLMAMSDNDILVPDCCTRAEVVVRLGEYNMKHGKNSTSSRDPRVILIKQRAPLFEKYGLNAWPDGVRRVQPYDKAGSTMQFVCANDPSCQFHVKYNFIHKKGVWEHQSDHAHNCTWNAAEHQKVLAAKTASSKVVDAREMWDAAKQLADSAANESNQKSLALAEEHLKLCVQREQHAITLAGAKTKQKQQQPTPHAAWGLKPSQAAAQCHHLWAAGKEPGRSEIKKHLMTLMNTEPTRDYVRRVQQSARNQREEVSQCHSCPATKHCLAVGLPELE